MTALFADWLAQARAQTQQAPAQPRCPLWVAGHALASMPESLWPALNDAVLARHGLALARRADGWHLTGEGGMSEQLNRLAQALHAAGCCGPWRQEQLAVCNDQGLRLATIERGAVRPLGIATQAVHLVGALADGRLWVQQRCDNKPNNPGMWDTLMGGMVSADDTVAQAVERETWEEAGLRVADLQDMRHGGHLDFARPSEEAADTGYMRERIDWFAATVPLGLKPQNQDGEVQGFALMAPEQVQQWLVQRRFTPEASLVLAAYLGW